MKRQSYGKRITHVGCQICLPFYFVNKAVKFNAYYIRDPPAVISRK